MKSQRTTASGPNLACYLTCTDQEQGMVLYSEVVGGQKSKEEYFLTYDNYLKFKF